MPRFGEASVVGRRQSDEISKAWQDDRPVASAVVPAALAGWGATKLNAGIRPNVKGRIAGAEKRLASASDDIITAGRRAQAAKLAGHAPTGANPLKFVGQKGAAHRAHHNAKIQMKTSEMRFMGAQRNLTRTQRAAPKLARAGVRRANVLGGGALLSAGGYGLYRRFGPRKPVQEAQQNA